MALYTADAITSLVVATNFVFSFPIGCLNGTCDLIVSIPIHFCILFMFALC